MFYWFQASCYAHPSLKIDGCKDNVVLCGGNALFSGPDKVGIFFATIFSCLIFQKKLCWAVVSNIIYFTPTWGRFHFD